MKSVYFGPDDPRLVRYQYLIDVSVKTRQELAESKRTQKFPQKDLAPVANNHSSESVGSSSSADLKGTLTPGVGTDEFQGEITRKDGLTEKYIWINVGKWGGLTFDFAKDADGKDRREVRLSDVRRINILGSTQLTDGTTLIKNQWAKADIALRNHAVISGVYLNLTGIGGTWKWCYRTPAGIIGDIDENVSTVTFTQRTLTRK